MARGRGFLLHCHIDMSARWYSPDAFTVSRASPVEFIRCSKINTKALLPSALRQISSTDHIIRRNGHMLDMKNVVFDQSIDLIRSASPRERCSVNAKFGLIIKRVVLKSIRSIHPSVDERKINGDVKRVAVETSSITDALVCFLWPQIMRDAASACKPASSRLQLKPIQKTRTTPQTPPNAVPIEFRD